jgi:hypothetical protein
MNRVPQAVTLIELRLYPANPPVPCPVRGVSLPGREAEGVLIVISCDRAREKRERVGALSARKFGTFYDSAGEMFGRVRLSSCRKEARPPAALIATTNRGHGNFY